MNRKFTCFVCLTTILLSACTADEPRTHEFVVAEFADQISETVIFQAENRAYVATGRGTHLVDRVSEVYRVDLLSGEKTFLFSTDSDGYSSNFIVSADEKFIAIGVYPNELSVENTPRLELFDLSTNMKTVLKTAANGSFVPFGFDPENKTLLYAKYGTSDQNKVRKIDLVSGTEELMIFEEGSGSVLAINPVTSDLLMRAGGNIYITTWNGTVVGEPITGFQPQFFSPDGEEIIGHRGMVTHSWDYQEVVRYMIASAEVESLTGAETKGAFYASSMSLDQNFVLGVIDDSGNQLSNDLYVVNTVTLERDRLMSTRDGEQAIGFFDAGRKVLFVAPKANAKILYGLKLD